MQVENEAEDEEAVRIAPLLAIYKYQQEEEQGELHHAQNQSILSSSYIYISSHSCISEFF